MAATNPFGLIPGEGTPFHWLDHASRSTEATWRALRPQIRADRARMKAQGWGDTWPDIINPGDIAPMRCAGSLLASEHGADVADAVMSGRITEYFTRRLIEVDIRRSERTYAGELVHLDADTAVALLGAYRPEQDLFHQARLPWQNVFVTFSAPLRFDADSAHWKLGDAAELEQIDSIIRQNNDLTGGGGASSPIGLWTGGGALWAVGLEADAEGHLDDWVRWYVYATDQETGRWAEPTVQIGRISAATLAPLVENLVCALSWGKFTQRDRETLPDSEREQRKLFNTNSFKRRAKTGAVDGVRILDIAHTTTSRDSEQTTPSGTTRTVTSHLRRGHWRRVRVVTRDEHGERIGRRDGEQGIDWTYAGRWIQPTLVSGAGAGKPAGTRIYRLPEPPTSEDWDNYRRYITTDSTIPAG